MDIRCRTCGTPMKIYNSWDGCEMHGIMLIKCRKCGIRLIREYASLEELDEIWENIEKEINEQMK